MQGGTPFKSFLNFSSKFYHTKYTNTSLKVEQSTLFFVGHIESIFSNFPLLCSLIIEFSHPYIKKYYSTDSQTTAILCCIFDVLNNSSDLINLLRVIQQYPFDLKFELLKLDVSGATFDTLKQRLILPFSLKSSKKAKIDRAVAFYFCRYASFYGKGESYKKI